MSSIAQSELDGPQIEFDRGCWFNHEAIRLLEESVEDPTIGADKTLSILLHHGLGLPLLLVAKLQQTTKNVIAKRCITGTKRIRGREPVSGLSSAVTVNTWVSNYVSHATDMDQSTQRIYSWTCRRLCEQFDGRELRSITVSEAERFEELLTAEGLASRTISRMIGASRDMFRAAVRMGIIDSNPFQFCGSCRTKRQPVPSLN